MKSVLKNKLVIGATAAVITVGLAGGGLYLSQKNNNKPVDNNQEENSPKLTEEQVQNNLDTKEQGQQNTSPAQNGTTNQSPTQSQASDDLADVTLQASLNKADNSISVALYGAPGSYSIEVCKGPTEICVNAPWSNVSNGQNYSGAGGMTINDKIPVSETERTYRVIREVNGVKSTQKLITVDRNLVQSNGVINFPRGL